jgi:hypothetical protein
LVRLIDELVEQRVPHRFEGQELVVRPVDEDKADAAVAHVRQSQSRRRTKQLAYVTSRDGQVTPVWEVRTNAAPETLPYRREVPARWNGLAIAAFVLALVPALPIVAPIVSIVLGLVGHRQATQRNERGRGLAKWGITIAVASLALSAVWIYQLARHAMP